MESFSTNTLFSSSSFLARNRARLPALRPALSQALPSRSWRPASDSFDPLFIAPCPESDLHLARRNIPQGGPAHLLYPDSVKVYPSPPSGSSSSASTISLPEESGESTHLYFTHLAGVLDSPPVMRREDLAPQRPLTPPPTMPHPTLNLPEADVDLPLYGQEVDEVDDIEEQYADDESYPSPSGSSPPHSAKSDLSLSPLSPSWDPPCAQALSIASSQDFSDSDHPNALFSPCDACAPLALDYCHPLPHSPRKPSSLLDVDVEAPTPLLALISIPWVSSQSPESDPEPPSSSSSSSSLTSLSDYDELPPPSSPLISRLDLPDLEDDGLPKIIPSSPSRRSCLGLPDSDSDVEMSDSAIDPVLTLPGQPLLSLPGAETDDDLIPRIVALQSRTIPFTSSRPLLFIDDPRDVPLPRSPSPEDFDLCLSPEDITDPELAQLFDLRKRSIAAERAARRVEALTDDVDLFTQAEARKIRKRERERSKEVGTLIRLKLGDGVATCPQEQSSTSPEWDPQNHARRRGAIGSVPQLVAQMVFRRNETSRPLAKRKTTNGPREYVRSALSDGVTAYD